MFRGRRLQQRNAIEHLRPFKENVIRFFRKFKHLEAALNMEEIGGGVGWGKHIYRPREDRCPEKT